MEFSFNDKNKLSDNQKNNIKKEVLSFIENNKDFEVKKESFLRNRNYSFSIKNNKIEIYYV